MYHASTNHSIEIRFLLSIAGALVAAFLGGCDASSSPTGATMSMDTRVDTATFSTYFTEAEKRANLWFCGNRVSGQSCDAMPSLPAASEVMGRIRFVEEAPNGQTCYYNGETDVITVPADKWGSGCVPHELLHASLHMIGSHCWRDIEHSPFDGGC